MPITLNRKVRFSHPDLSYGGTTFTEYLFGAIGFKVNADIRVDVSWDTLLVNMSFDGATDIVERLDGGISSWLEDGFKVGDTVAFTGTANNNITTTIISLTDSLMGVTAAALTTETVIANAFGETLITAMDFYPNLIGNSIFAGVSQPVGNLSNQRIQNLTDRETIPRYFADTITDDVNNPTVMKIGTNSKGWVTPADSATIYKIPLSNHIQTFIISHTFTITPIFLADQLEEIQHRLAPAAGVFEDKDCLKYVYTVDGKFSDLDPDIPHTTDGNVDFPLGQTGWFNEFVNGRRSEWKKKSLIYADNATGGGLVAVDYCKINDVTAELTCDVAVLEPTYIIQVMYLPINEERYVNTLTNYQENFIYERAVIPIGGGEVQGENVGDFHFLKDVSASIPSTNTAQIVFKIDFSAFLQGVFDKFDVDNRNYLIFITAQNLDS